MKVVVLVKATPRSERGIVVDESFKQLMEAMGKFNEQLVKAGIIQEADGLKPSRFGKRVHFSGEHVSVVDGPFAETKELVAGYWIWNVKSMDEALEWAQRCPNPMPGEEGILELRPTNTMEDFAELMTDERREKYEQMREQIASQPTSTAKAKVKAKPKAKGKAKRKPAPTSRAAAARKPVRARGKK